MDQAKEGAAALDAKEYKKAIECYSRAINIIPTSADYHIKRSTAYQRSDPPQLSEAFADAEKAVHLAIKRAKRELIVQAQLRRAIILFALERYGDAAFVFGIVERMDPNEKTLPIWKSKIQSRLSNLPEGDSKATVTVKEVPEVGDSATSSNTKGSRAPETKEVATRADVTEGSTVSTNGSEVAAPSTRPPVVQTPADKIRHDWYQTVNDVYITILAKGVPKDKAQIEIEEKSVSISFPAPGSSGAETTTYELTFDPLFATIDVKRSTCSIMASKIEIVLKKAQSSQKWHALESSDPVTDIPTATVSAVPTSILQSSTSSTVPSYPTSSRTGPKNWDKLATELTTKKSDKSNGKSAVSDDDDDYDYDKEDGDEVNGFFKKLYSGASPEVQRAMMKSYTESNGTALSTNWDEVSKGKVETSPPTGMEAKKWN